MTACKKEKDVMLKVIEAYKNMPHLWEKSHKDYTNRVVRARGYRVLLEMYRHFDEDATIDKLKKKIENMRTIYAKVSKRMNASKRKGDKRAYIPSIYYFDAFKFLDYRTVSRPSETSDTVTLKIEKLSSSEDEVDGSTSAATSIDYPQHRRQITTESPLQRRENTTSTADDTLSNREAEVFGKSIGFQMKDITKRQLTIAQKLISDVIFYARTDRLNEESCLVTNPGPGASHQRNMSPSSPNYHTNNNTSHFSHQDQSPAYHHTQTPIAFLCQTQLLPHPSPPPQCGDPIDHQLL